MPTLRQVMIQMIQVPIGFLTTWVITLEFAVNLREFTALAGWFLGSWVGRECNGKLSYVGYRGSDIVY